jgi:hypothetical protein
MFLVRFLTAQWAEHATTDWPLWPTHILHSKSDNKSDAKSSKLQAKIHQKQVHQEKRRTKAYDPIF